MRRRQGKQEDRIEGMDEDFYLCRAFIASAGRRLQGGGAAFFSILILKKRALGVLVWTRPLTDGVQLTRSVDSSMVPFTLPLGAPRVSALSGLKGVGSTSNVAATLLSQS